ncbi:multisubstrate pseudouridine synthase 7 [Neophaeococcomyces mojaviensis]|uniref:Multisubstrate pseudouridine synthase 7 n=1 Tax=Neophaeococcomyces mojaviensis TaxID=3383035 RepID=A0ACC3A139_9EURO|nr:multisubstrate pseudouridine synthase 7 [Knufia sp. JES_112]
MDETHSEGPPAKRRRVSINSNDDKAVSYPEAVGAIASEQPSAETSKEFEVGIQAYVNSSYLSLSAVLKKRYTDFLVNEILPDGTVLHLKSTRPPKQKQKKPRDESATVSSRKAAPESHNEAAAVAERSTQPEPEQNGKTDEKPEAESNTVTDTDREKLVNYLNETAATEILQLYQSIRDHPKKKSKEHPTVRTEFTTDRYLRGEIHQFIRTTFSSRIESSTDKEGTLILTASHSSGRGNQQGSANGWSQNKSQRPSKLSWLERGGEYVHFTLFKENKDTMEAISWLTKQLKCNAKVFQFAGTKDRRAVTVQRCSAYRIEAERLAAQNQSLRNSKIGDFEYHPHGLELGDLNGNEFVITLRDCHLSSAGTEFALDAVKSNMESRMQSLRENGYLNYYGQQRFGTFSVRTDVIGQHILREDFKAACDAILYYPPSAASSEQETGGNVSQDDKSRMQAISKWREDNVMNAALDILPRKFSAEAQLIRHLSRHPNDYFGALMTIQRNLRLMYVHAYQSLVWNLAASNRIKLHGTAVVEGDLVLVNEHKDKEVKTEISDNGGEEIKDAEGDIILAPGENDRAKQSDDVFERARALTQAEVDSGQYSIFDIVLPQPGYDILYPANASGAFYETFMKSADGGGLDPQNMRRKQRDFSLSGSYRKLLARIGEAWSVEVHQYDKDEQQFVRTDWEVMQAEKNGSKNEDGGDAQTDVQVPNATSETDHDSVANSGSKTAVVLKFQLGSSQYATMALRELSKGGIVPHKPEFSGGR